jgi:O-antigen/teichoic acid export membrane protein
LSHNAIALLGQTAVVVQAIVLIPLLVRSAGVATYGAWSLLSTLLTFVFGVSAFGTAYRVARYLPTAQDAQRRRQLFYPQFVFQSFSLVALGLPLLALARSFAEASSQSFSLLLALCYLITYLLFAQANQYLRYTNRITSCILQSALQTYAQVGVALALAAAGLLSIDALLVSYSAVMALASLPVLALVARELGGPIVLPTMAMLRGDFAVGLPLVASFVVDTVLSIGDRFVMVGFLPLADIGAYVAAYALGSLPLLLPRAAGMVVPQMLATAVDEGHPEKAKAIISLSLRLFALIAIPFCAGSAVLGSDVLGMVANADVVSRAALVVPIVAVGSFLYGASMFTSHLLFVHAKTRSLLSANALAAASNVLLNVALLGMIRSVVVPATVTVVSYLILLTVMTRRLAPEWRVRIGMALIAKAIVAAGVMAWILSLLRVHTAVAGIVGIVVATAAGLTIYAVVLLALHRGEVRRHWNNAVQAIS